MHRVLHRSLSTAYVQRGRVRWRLEPVEITHFYGIAEVHLYPPVGAFAAAPEPRSLQGSLDPSEEVLDEQC